MTEREQLWYLIDEVLNEKYDIRIFCEEFTRIYNFELDYIQLPKMENEEFRHLCEMTARFSDDENELRIPHMYFSKENILDKVRSIKELLRQN